MTLTGEAIDAERAEQWGLVWRVVDDEHLSAETDTLARNLASGPQLALQVIKCSLRAALHESFEAALEAESVAQGKLGRSLDYREAVDAFMNKRPARFA